MQNQSNCEIALDTLSKTTLERFLLVCDKTKAKNKVIFFVFFFVFFSYLDPSGPGSAALTTLTRMVRARKALADQKPFRCIQLIG